MTFEILKLSPLFFDKVKLKKVQDEFLVNMNKDQNEKFVLWYAEKIRRLTQ